MSSTPDQLHPASSTDKLASAQSGDAPGTEAVFLQARRLVGLCDKLQHGARHVTSQLELLQRERGRLTLLVNDARGHVAEATGGTAGGSDK